MRTVETTQLSYCLRKTAFGPVAVLWEVHQEQPRIRRVLLSKDGLPAERLVQRSFPDVRYSFCAEIDPPRADSRVANPDSAGFERNSA